MDAATRFIAGTRTHSLLIKRLLLNHGEKTGEHSVSEKKTVGPARTDKIVTQKQAELQSASNFML